MKPTMTSYDCDQWYKLRDCMENIVAASCCFLLIIKYGINLINWNNYFNMLVYSTTKSI